MAREHNRGTVEKYKMMVCLRYLDNSTNFNCQGVDAVGAALFSPSDNVPSGTCSRLELCQTAPTLFRALASTA